MIVKSQHRWLPFSLPYWLPHSLPFWSLLPFLFLISCGTHGGYHSGYVPPQKRGLPGQSVDAVVKNIQPNTTGEDVMPQSIGINGTTGARQPTFEVFMMPLSDQTDYLSEAGLVTLTGHDKGDLL